MIRFDRSVVRRAATAALLIALAAGVSACGRKGPLDPPANGATLGPSTLGPAGQGDLEYDAQGRPLAPQGPKRRIPLDVLLD